MPAEYKINLDTALGYRVPKVYTIARPGKIEHRCYNEIYDRNGVKTGETEHLHTSTLVYDEPKPTLFQRLRAWLK